MIRTENLTRIFRTEEVETIALNGVNIEVEDGEFIDVDQHRHKRDKHCHESGLSKRTLLSLSH